MTEQDLLEIKKEMDEAVISMATIDGQISAVQQRLL